MVFCAELDDAVAARSLGASLLRHGHGQLRGMDKVSGLMQDLYGASVGSFVTKSFLRHLFVMRGVAVASEFLPGKTDPLAKLLNYATSVAKDPYLGRSDFEESVFQREKTNLLQAIDSLADNKSHFVEQKLVEKMFQGHCLGRPANGFREEVEALDLNVVAKEFRRVVEDCPLFIYVVSPRSTREIQHLLKNHLDLDGRPELRALRIKLPPIHKRVQKTRTSEAITQGRLALGFRMEDYNRSRDAYAAVLADMVLGGGSSSRLFKEVREKRSLAYSVGSSFDASTGTSLVGAGVDAKNIEPAVRIINKQIRDLGRGKLAAEDLRPVLAAIRQHVEGLGDSADGLINFHLSRALGVRKEVQPEDVMARYERTTLKKIVEAAGRYRLDGMYVLAPQEAKV